ncbi:MAG: adenylate kinase family protein, partial [Planctomycetota bacterium]
SRVFSLCNAIYHIKTNPSKSGNYCEKCNGPLIQREDDKEETIRKRITEYTAKTMPLLNIYRLKALLYEVETNRKVEEIFDEIVKIIFQK